MKKCMTICSFWGRILEKYFKELLKTAKRSIKTAFKANKKLKINIMFK
jgi:hypothetical protein